MASAGEGHPGARSLPLFVIPADGPTPKVPAVASKLHASILVLTYNELEHATRPCIESVLEHTDLVVNELIVVDNASADATPEFLARLGRNHENMRVQLNSANKGYAGGNNDGMRMARGRYIVLLNNDTLVSDGWLPGLLRLLETDRTVGMVGPVTNSCGNEQRIEIPGLTERNFAELAHQYCKRQAGVWFDTEKLGFFCVAMRRELPETIGYLDEDFGVGMFEDDDFCLRVRTQAHQKLAVVEDCFVYHKGSVSFKKLGYADYRQLFERNREHFFQKHQIRWTFSDLALSYWRKFDRDLADYARRAEAIDPAIERIRVRFQNYKHLLIQIQSAEAGGRSVIAKTASRAAARGRWEVRGEVFRNEFLRGSLTQKRNYLRAVVVSLIAGRTDPVRPAPAFDFGPLMEEVKRVRAASPFKQVIVFPPTIDYHWMKQRPQQLAGAFADAGCLVLYGTLNHRSDAVEVTERVGERLYLLSEKYLGYLHHAFTAAETLYYCLWPNNGKYLGAINYSTLVYDYMDELSLLELPSDEVEHMHQALLEEADLITVSADRLKSKIPERYQSKTLLLNNAVEAGFIERVAAAGPDRELTERCRGKPIVGYFGAIAEWLDFPLIASVAKAFPHCELVFVGPMLGVQHEVDKLERRYSNVHFLPPVPHARLPAILQAFAVCIIPFARNEITDAVSPVKLFEYMSSGKPVVTSDLQECQKYPGVLAEAGHAAFVRNLGAALERCSDAELADKLIAVARANTWEQRVSTVLGRLNRACQP